MKNIHLIPTDKPSRLTIMGGKLLLSSFVSWESKSIDWENGDGINQNIYITSDEEINQQTKPCWCINTIKNTWDTDLIYYQGSIPQYHYKGFKKIILTNDQDLIKDSVQAIDNEFLEWFVKNPSCEEVEIEEGVRYEDEWIDNEDGGEIFQHQYCCYKIIIPTEEPTISDEAKQRAANYMRLKGALEPKDVVLGYKTSLDAQMLDRIEPKQETVNMNKNTHYVDFSNPNADKISSASTTTIKQETLEEAAEKLILGYELGNTGKIDIEDAKEMLIGFVKWQAKRMYSEEDLLNAFKAGMMFIGEDKGSFKEWFEQFKKK